MLNTVLSRCNYLIEQRKKKIRCMEKILSGKDKRYKYDLTWVARELQSEKQLLRDLLTEDYYKTLIKNESQETLLQFCT